MSEDKLPPPSEVPTSSGLSLPFREQAQHLERDEPTQGRGRGGVGRVRCSVTRVLRWGSDALAAAELRRQQDRARTAAAEGSSAR